MASAVYVPHSTILCDGTNPCLCACHACKHNEEHADVSMVRENTQEVVVRNRDRERLIRMRYSLGELWTQLESRIHPRCEILLSRQVGINGSVMYSAEIYDSRAIPKVDAIRKEARTPELAVIDLLLDLPERME